MKNELKSLKAKFSQFALSTEQVKKVNGGNLYTPCEVDEPCPPPNGGGGGGGGVRRDEYGCLINYEFYCLEWGGCLQNGMLCTTPL